MKLSNFKWLLLAALLLASGCESSDEPPSSVKAVSNSENGGHDSAKLSGQLENKCDIDFSEGSAAKCVLSDNKNAYNVSVNTETLEDDEWLILSLSVVENSSHKSFSLKGTEDVSILQGDILTLMLCDINFDGKADLAMSTSFGVANQYFDYWVSDVEKQGFTYVGNYPMFTVDIENKVLRASVKESATLYTDKIWQWSESGLIEKQR